MVQSRSSSYAQSIATRMYIHLVTVLRNLTSSCKQLISRSFRCTFFREVTFSIFDQRDGQKDTCDDGKKDQVCCLKDGTDGVVSTASTTTSNPLPTLYCYDISGSNDRGG